MALVYAFSIFEAFGHEAFLHACELTETPPALPPNAGLGRLLGDFRSRFGLRLDAESEPRFSDFLATRNLWVHASGTVNDRYLRSGNPDQRLVGQLRNVAESDVEWAISLFPLVASDVLDAIDRLSATVQFREDV